MSISLKIIPQYLLLFESDCQTPHRQREFFSTMNEVTILIAGIFDAQDNGTLYPVVPQDIKVAGMNVSTFTGALC